MRDRIVVFAVPRNLLLATIVLLPTVTHGASYYISTTGSDSRGCSNATNDSCASFSRCASVMSPGDTCFALDGTYLVHDTVPSFPNSGWVFRSPGGSPSAKKRFTSLSQNPKAVILRPASPRTQDTFYLLGSPQSSQSDHLEFDHLTFEGRIHGAENLDGFTFHHNIARCPNIAAGGGNQSVIYLQENINDMHRGLRISENLFLMEASCDQPPGNVGFISAFSFNGAIVENNDFINTSAKIMTAFILLKRGNKDTIIRYNYFRGIVGDPLGVWLMDCNGDSSLDEFGDRSNQGGSPDCNNQVHHNVFVNLSSGAQCRSESGRNEWIYNNTIYNAQTRCLGVDSNIPGSGDAYRIFNNICAGRTVPGDGHVAVPPYGKGTRVCMSRQDYFDNNLYWPVPSERYLWQDCEVDSNGDGTAESVQRYSSLAAWKAHLAQYGKEQSSTAEDPLFINADAGDFRLKESSPARSGGRGGAWATGRGAYVSGVETIGCSFDSSCHGSAGGGPPGPGPPPIVRGIIRTDVR